MALTQPVIRRIRQAYRGSVLSARNFVLLTQSDVRQILLDQNANDVVAKNIKPSHDHGFMSPDAA